MVEKCRQVSPHVEDPDDLDPLVAEPEEYEVKSSQYRPQAGQDIPAFGSKLTNVAFAGLSRALARQRAAEPNDPHAHAPVHPAKIGRVAADQAMVAGQRHVAWRRR